MIGVELLQYRQIIRVSRRKISILTVGGRYKENIRAGRRAQGHANVLT